MYAFISAIITPLTTMLASVIIMLMLIMILMMLPSALYIRNNRSHILRGYIIAIMAGLGATFALEAIYQGGRAQVHLHGAEIALFTLCALIASYAFTSAWESRNVRLSASN